MGEEEIRKIAKEEFMNNVMKQLDSSLIFTYIQNLENQLQQKENIINELEHDFKSYDLEYLRGTYQGSLADFIETELKRMQELKRWGE